MAELERLSGNLTAAERGLRLVYEQQRQAGDEGYLASTAVELADQGQADEALQLTEISKAGAASDDVAAQLVWRRVRARVLAPRGSVQEAKRLALEAVGIGERTDWLQGHADALLDLAGCCSSPDAAGTPRTPPATPWRCTTRRATWSWPARRASRGSRGTPMATAVLTSVRSIRRALWATTT
jgi:hypothetical protein